MCDLVQLKYNVLPRENYETMQVPCDYPLCTYLGDLCVEPDFMWFIK
jgi:hypothetical protein